ncbi:hypothetical protein D3C73_930150 [compost metagenome]
MKAMALDNRDLVAFTEDLSLDHSSFSSSEMVSLSSLTLSGFVLPIFFISFSSLVLLAFFGSTFGTFRYLPTVGIITTVTGFSSHTPSPTKPTSIPNLSDILLAD